MSTCDYFNPDVCSNTFPGFCAYHSYYTESDDPANTPYIFLTLPYEPATACHTPDGSSVEPEPNGQVDVLIGAMSHEMRESTTDPTFYGWYDSNGNEADDKCYVEYGSTIGTRARQYLSPARDSAPCPA